MAGRAGLELLPSLNCSRAARIPRVSTSIFKWKPDYLAAEPLFAKAGAYP